MAVPAIVTDSAEYVWDLAWRREFVYEDSFVDNGKADAAAGWLSAQQKDLFVLGGIYLAAICVCFMAFKVC